MGKYKIFIKYNNKLSTIQIICKDTLAPVLAFPKNVDVIKESDLESIDFKSLIIATDLSPLKEIQIDTSQIDIKIESENNKPNEDITISQSNEKNNVKDHLDNDHQQTKPLQTVYWYECYLCGLYVDSNVSLEDAKKKFDQTKCTDAIEFSGIEWRHSRFHYGINHS